MSADRGGEAAGHPPGSAVSRHSNGSYPASAGTGSNAADSENREYAEERPDVPTVEERVTGLLERWPDRCMVPVSETHGTKLREEAVQEPETVEETVPVGEFEETTTYQTVKQSAHPHIAVVEEFLDWFERYRDLYLKLEKRERHKAPEEFLIGLDNSYSTDYQDRQYARLKAWERQIVGGDYSDGDDGDDGDDRDDGDGEEELVEEVEEVEGAYEEPVVAIGGLTQSAYREPGDPASGLKPVCDHDREIRDAWTGSRDSVKRTLRYVLEDSLGLPSDAYTWWWQSEPHGGEGANTDRSHSHPVIMLDAAAADVSADAISPETFRPVVAKHVSLVEGATWDAHDVEDTFTVESGDNIESVAGYVAKYIGVDPETDLLERSDSYLMWAASQWATATQKYSRDRVCTAATKADACHQRYASEESDQAHDHGEVVVRSAAGAPTTFECVECGSSFGIDQDCTLTEHRTAQAAADGVCAADGGEVVEEASETADGLSDGLQSRWRDARAAAVVGGPAVERECDHREPDTCPLCATETEAPHHTVSGEVPIPESAAPSESVEEESASFRRPPMWEPVAVVRAWSEESESVGAPSGVEYAEVVVEEAGSAAAQVPERCRPLPPPSWLERREESAVGAPEPWERHPVEESDVREGILPPPSVIAREERERTNGERITPKSWPDDWYARQYEETVEEESADRDGLDESQRAAVIELVENESVASAVEVVGRLCLPPSAVEAVRRAVRRA